MMVSVVICTWNRAEMLGRTLAQMCNVRVRDGVTWELIIVNNNCRDNTDEIIKVHSGRLPIVRLYEGTPGLSNARNCAIRAARGDLILWTDDDVVVDPGWLLAYCDAARNWPDAAYFGGTVDPMYASRPPNWAVGNWTLVEGPFALRQLGSDVRVMNPGEYPFGANMGFRRSALMDVVFDPALGRTRDRLISGEETEVVNRLRAQGAMGIWVGNARVQHYIPKERLTRRYVWRWWAGEGATAIRRSGLPDAVYILGMPRWAIRRYLGLQLRCCWSWLRNHPDWGRDFKRAAQAWGVLTEARVQRKAGRAPRVEAAC